MLLFSAVFFIFKFMFRSLNLLTILLIAILPAPGQTVVEKAGRPVIQRLQGELVFDGIPDEAAWQLTEPFPMVTHQPVFGKEPEERTDVRILFDAQYVYVGASLYTSDPSAIMNTSKKRDELKPDCDWVAVVFDTYNDNETGLSFWTTPSGLRTDMAIFNDAQAGMVMPLSPSWNTHWDVESRITDEGWFSEMRIPVSSLKFQEKDREVVMGMILIRWIPQHNATYIYPPIPAEYGDWSLMKVSMAQDVVFPGLNSRKPLYITPYVLGGISKMNELNDAETEYKLSRDEKFEAGLDLKYGITSNLTMDITANTDFAQVEADDEMVNLTRFDLYFEEKRQFFLERSSVFDFNTAGPTTMFYSRRIGLDDEGKIVPIIGGLRLIGRKSGWDMGFLNMQTMKSDSLPSENFGVLRVRKRILNENSYAGGIYTSRLGLDGSFNQVYGFDGLLRITGDEYLKLVWGQTFETGYANKPFALENARFVLNWQRRKDVGFYYDVFLSGAGKDYNPGIGFQNRYDYAVYGGMFNYNWLSPESSPIFKHGPRLQIFDWFNQSRGTRETVDLGLSWEMQLKSTWFFNAAVQYQYDHVFEEFPLSDDAEIPEDEYSFTSIAARFRTPMTRSVSLFMEYIYGQYYDGMMNSLMLQSGWSVASFLQFSGTYMFNKIDIPVRDQEFISHIGRLKAELMFTTTLSLSAFVQYNSAADIIGSNIRFRYNPREGNDLWLVFNEGTNTNLQRELPHRPSLAARTIMLKYTYTFRL